MPRPALEGVRVLDFSAFIAGPEAGLLLSFLGAEVLKVESRGRLDPLRSTYQQRPDDVDSSRMFGQRNLNKLGVTINLHHPKGVALSKRLAGISDAVLENFRPGVMAKLGLGYPQLREANPSLVMVSISGFGQTGPDRENVALASVFGASSGLGGLTGYEDGPPAELRMPMDASAGAAGAFAMLAGLMRRERTGEGLYVDLSASALVSSFLGESLVDYFASGRVATRQGNRDLAMAPHNCYPCRGEDRWISIAIANDTEWAALCGTLNKPEWLSDSRFADPYLRWRHQDELDRLIAETTTEYTVGDLVDMLQAAGAAAAPSASSEDLCADPHLKAREAFTELHHPSLGRQVVLSPPWRFSCTPAAVRRHAPLLGDHNEYVFGQLLGLTSAEIGALVADRVIY